MTRVEEAGTTSQSDDGGSGAADGGTAPEEGSPHGRGTGAPPATDLCELLADERTRTVLATVADEALSVKEVAERSGASTATVYRRVDDLVAHDLLAEETRVDREGNHYTVYRTKVERISVEVDPAEDRVTADLTYRDAADQFVELWEGLGE